MFGKRITGLFLRNVAIDFGTVNTLIVIKRRGIVLREPSVVAVSAENKKSILAVGNETVCMLDRTPGGINVTYPMCDGVVADGSMAEVMLKYYITKVLGYKVGALGIRLVMCVPLCSTAVECKALVEAVRGAGARDMLMIDEPKKCGSERELSMRIMMHCGLNIGSHCCAYK